MFVFRNANMFAFLLAKFSNFVNILLDFGHKLPEFDEISIRWEIIKRHRELPRHLRARGRRPTLALRPLASNCDVQGRFPRHWVKHDPLTELAHSRTIDVRKSRHVSMRKFSKRTSSNLSGFTEGDSCKAPTRLLSALLLSWRIDPKISRNFEKWKLLRKEKWWKRILLIRWCILGNR